MTALATLKAIRAQGGELYAEGEAIHYKGSPLTEGLRSALRANKPALLILLATSEREQTIQEIEAAYHFLCQVERYANHWYEVEPVVRSWDNQTLEKNAKQYRRRIKEAGGIQTPETPPTS